MKVIKRLSQVTVLLALVFAVGAGTAVYSVRQDAEELRGAFATLRASHSEKTLPLLRDLLSFEAVSSNERVHVQQMIGRFSAMNTSSPNLQDDTQEFSDSLKELRQLLTQMAGNEEVTGGSSFAELKTLSYGQGEVQQLFYAYNQGVLLWNQRERTGVGELVASALRLEKILMVNPDGSTEFVPTISF
jgi:hypothetical protein